MFWRDASPIKTFQWRGYQIPVNLSYDRVLTMFDVFEDNDLRPHEQWEIAFELFVDDEEIVNAFDTNDKAPFLIDMFKELLRIDLTDESGEDEQIPSFDFHEDASRIFSSFLFDYNMNLYEQQGKLSWSDFIELLFNLSDDTQFSQAVSYRLASIPKKDKYNEDEVKRIRAMKEKYAFKSERMVKRVEEIKGKALLRKMQEHTNFIKKGGKE
ncbi:Gp15 family bacteriophage protein [Bacteroides graminisolvens]|uniref:Gp15 family bacteriophage protein n=1 Tax=Bacteroides graminisolvens TaxID=477666 RepID=UPI00240A2256|nr:Gp15 family bacteriophage protein [Bacteroides graminisolvens]